MVSPALREVLVRGDGAGECSGPHAAVGAAEHAVCGDRVQLSVRVERGAIVEARWRADGCPASMAVAALAAVALRGVPVAEAAAALRAAIAAHGGLHAAERHAEQLVLQALARATGGA
jgi:NifU-like protein involved in Fe-S cluster formation